ncbi:hypothetical protein Q9L58_010761 [Maublancomyces gigas]|uniref:Uncharacterized protein n=1 Tax=Discina gigas TaxID=1032678 RepID=A0ABR3G3F4_9PEZI
MNKSKTVTMFEYRITKYDPAVRREGKQYTEWTSVSDVGTAFDGVTLTRSAYEEVESAYIAAATAFFRKQTLIRYRYEISKTKMTKRRHMQKERSSHQWKPCPSCPRCSARNFGAS